MTKERETRKETTFWGNERDVIYENGRKVGEVKTEKRGDFFGIGGETVKVEYDDNGKEISNTRKDKRGGFIGIGADKVDVRYDASGNEVGHSKVEKRGDFLGFGGHHVRVEYDNDLKEISQTNSEKRGAFLGLGGKRVKVTRYSTTDTEKSSRKQKSTSAVRNLLFHNGKILLPVFQMVALCIFDDSWRNGVAEMISLFQADNFFIFEAFDIFSLVLAAVIIEGFMFLLHPIIIIMMINDGATSYDLILLILVYGPTYPLLYYWSTKSA